MAGPNDLTGQNIQDSYQKVLQVSSSGQITDGTGSIPASVGVEQIHFGNETDCKIYGNGAVITIDGDNYTNLFADNQIKLHAPQTVIGSANASNFFQVDGEISASGFISTDSSITASGVISSSDNIYGNRGFFRSYISASDIYIPAGRSISLDNGGGAVILYAAADNKISIGAGPDVEIEGQTFSGMGFTTPSPITASLISASGESIMRGLVVSTLHADLGTFDRIVTTEITSSIVSSSIIYSSGSNIFGDEVGSVDTHQFFGNITSSGTISASGDIHGANRYLRNLSSLVWDSGDENQTVIGLAANHNLQIYSGSTKTVTIDASSGNISSSGTITASNFHVPGQGRISFDNTDTDDQFIKGLDHAIVIDGDDFVKLKADDHVVYIDNSNNNTIEMNPNNGNVTMSGVFSQSDIGHGENIFGGDLTVHGRFRAVGSQVDIMSGSVTASVGLLAPGFTASHRLLQLGSADDTKQELVVYGKIQQKGSDLTIMSGSLTASANISTSATVEALSGSFGTGTTTITDKIETTGTINTTAGIRAPGFTASHKLLQLGSAVDTRQELIVHGKLQIKGSDVTIMSGSISASGDISMSGGSTLTTETGSFNHIITDGDTIEFRNAGDGAKMGSLKFDTSNGLQVKGADDTSGKTKIGILDVDKEFVVTGDKAEFSAPITSSIISCSSEATMKDMSIRGAVSLVGNLSSTKLISTTQGLQAPGFTASHRLLQLGSPLDTKQELIVHGTIRQKGSDLLIQSGSITASANISTSANIIGLTGSFGTGTTHVHDNIETAGISATGTVTANALGANTSLKAPGLTASHKLLQLGSAIDTRQELIVYGAIRQKGSELNIQSGSITASGDISSSATIAGLTGSFGTGTTTITDYIHTTGTVSGSGILTSGNIIAVGDISSDAVIAATEVEAGAGGISSKGHITTQGLVNADTGLRAPGFTASHKLLQLGSAADTKQELIIHGKLNVRGSDFTIMSGSITASGDISASGNVMAGGGGTGSFDHIITSQNTIEFRNPGTRAAVGYVSFDATNGIQPLNASFSALPRLADKLATARKIGGVSFDGSADVIPTGHLGSISSMKFIGADFNTIGRPASDNALATVTLNQNILGSPIEAKPSAAGTFYLHKQLPAGLSPRGVVVYGGEGLTYRVLATVMPTSKYGDTKTKLYFIDSATKGIAVGTAVSRQNISKGIQSAGISWDSNNFMLTIAVTAANAKASIYGGEISMG